jgi:TRAP-type mannitol/chloroaromatic compound transport system permease large subunit
MTIFIFVVSLLGAMALGMPLAFSLIVSGVALMLHLDNFDTQIVSQNLINGADNFPLMAVPFFMLAGELMNAGGMSRRIHSRCSGQHRALEGASGAPASLSR